MTLIEVLLLALIASVLYAAYVMRRRIEQMRDFRASMVAQKKEQEKADTPSHMQMNVLSVRPPMNASPNPQILELDHMIDKLYDARDSGVPFEGGKWDKKEDELISKMVDLFIKEADARLVSEGLRVQHSGSRS